jgi:hypothetical protein
MPGHTAQPSKNVCLIIQDAVTFHDKEANFYLIESRYCKRVQQHKALGGSVAVQCGETGSDPGHCVWIYVYHEYCYIRKVFRQISPSNKYFTDVMYVT